MTVTVARVSIVLAVIALTGWGPTAGGQPGEQDRPTVRAAALGLAVARIVDGDTIVLASGEKVRLAQIDAPELGSDECYARRSRAVASELLSGRMATVRLEFEPRLGRRDRHGRLLAYVFRGRTNVNRALVVRGAASVWFVDGVRGNYSGQLLAAARKAKAAGRGLWRACRARLTPTSGLTTRPRRQAPSRRGCHPAYDPCLRLVADLDCGEIDDALKPVRVKAIGVDPYRLDHDDDGQGCE